MKKLLVLLLAALALLVASPAPSASAYIDDPYINGHKFASTNLCVGSTLLQSYYRVGYVAQTINNKTSQMSLTYSTDCAAAGFPPSRRMVVGTFQNVNYPYCTLFTNQQTAWYNGFDRWTNGPGLYLNTAFSGCIGTQINRDHWISQMIAWHLGLTTLTNSEQDHVMNNSSWTADHVPLPIQVEANKIDALYLGLFCDVGSVC